MQRVILWTACLHNFMPSHPQITVNGWERETEESFSPLEANFFKAPP